MNATDRHTLTKAATIAGLTVTEKSAACTPAQLEVLQEIWPDGSKETSKRAALARVLASGMLVEDREEVPA